MGWDLSDDEDKQIAASPAMADISTGPILSSESRRLRHIVGFALRRAGGPTSELLNSHAGTRGPTCDYDDEEMSQSYSNLRSASADSGHIQCNGIDDTSDKHESDSTQSASDSDHSNTSSEATLTNRIGHPTFAFALYSPESTKPVYISEPRSGPNADFDEFSVWNVHSRDSSLVGISVWELRGNKDTSNQWSKCFSSKIDLERLIYAGSSLSKLDTQLHFSRNSFVLVLTDGCYVEDENSKFGRFQSKSMVDLKVKPRSMSPAPHHRRTPSKASSTTDLPGGLDFLSTYTLSFDTLMKIQTLEECIHDSERAQSVVIDKIDSTLNNCSFEQTQYISSLSDTLSRTKQAVDATRLEIASVRRQIQHMRRSIDRRKQLMGRGNTVCIKASNTATNCMDMAKKSRIVISALAETRLAHLARLSSQLGQVYNIEPTRKPLQFSICGICLPHLTTLLNYTFDEDEVGASYGFLTELVAALSKYMAVPMRYPIQPLSSNSVIFDPISSIQGSRLFPLFTKGQLLYRFEYGVYLLSKDVEQLMSAAKLQTADISLILANVKNLLLVLSTNATSNEILGT